MCLSSNPKSKLFFFLLLLFLPTQLGYHLWPPWTFILGRKIDYLSPTLYVTDILLLLTVVSWMISQKKILFQKHRFTKKQIIIFIFFILLMVSNILIATSPLNAVYGWVKICEYILLGCYIVNTRPAPHFFVPPLIIAGIYSSALGLLQIIFQRSIGGVMWWLGERTFTIDTPGIAKAIFCLPSFFPIAKFSCLATLRPYATFPHPNVLAGFLGVCVLLLLRYHRRFHPVFLLFLLVMVITFSRSAMIALGLTVCLSLLNHRRRLKIIVVGITTTAILVGTLPLFSSWVVDHESVVTRQYLMGAALSMISSHPLLGMGINNFLIALPKFLVVRTIYFLQPVHNMYVLLISQLGIVGSCLLTIILWLIKKSLPSSPLFPPLIFLLIIGFLDHYLLTLQAGQLLLTVIVSFFLIESSKNV